MNPTIWSGSSASTSRARVGVAAFLMMVASNSGTGLLHLRARSPLAWISPVAWLVGGEGDLLDLPGFHLSLHRRLQEHLESLRDWRGGGGHQCPPVERFGSTQLLVEVVELDVPESDLEDTVAGTLGGERLDMEVHDVHGSHLRSHRCQLLGLDLDSAGGELELDGGLHGNVGRAVGVNSSSHQLVSEGTDVTDVARVGVGGFLDDGCLQFRDRTVALEGKVTPGVDKSCGLALDEDGETHL